MMERSEQSIDCPYCWERISILLDAEEVDQEYTEDCQVCCRPIVIRLMDEGGAIVAWPRREDD